MVSCGTCYKNHKTNSGFCSEECRRVFYDDHDAQDFRMKPSIISSGIQRRLAQASEGMHFLRLADAVSKEGGFPLKDVEREIRAMLDKGHLVYRPISYYITVPSQDDIECNACKRISCAIVSTDINYCVGDEDVMLIVETSAPECTPTFHISKSGEQAGKFSQSSASTIS